VSVTERDGAVEKVRTRSAALSAEEQAVARRLSGGFWYRYRAAFRELRPLLVANGAIIQGTGTTPHVPIQLWEHAGAEV